MAKQIQVSTIAKPRDEYTSMFQPNTETKQEWIPKKPSVFKKLKFENDVSLNTDDYCPVYKSYTSNDTFVASKNGCVVFVLCVGGSGYGTDTKGFTGAFSVGWSDPVGGWQIRTNQSHGTGNGVNYKFEAQNKSATQNNYIHNPPENSVVTPSSFGKYLSANAGLSIEANTITNKQIKRQWYCTGWDGWWAIGDRYQRAYWAYETQDIRLSSGSYDGNLVGTSGEAKFGIFTLKPNEVVSISVGEGFIKGHVDVVYFELRNSNNETLQTPSKPNDVTAGIPLPNPNPPTTTPPVIPLTLSLNPAKIELEIGSAETIEIITNANSWTFSIDDTIASFDEASKEISAIAKGDTMLTIEGERDGETIRRAVAVKVIEKQVVTPTPTPPTQPQLPQLPKQINYFELYPNLQNMNEEQLAYMYVTTLAWSKTFSLVQNDNNMTIIVNTISEQVKQDLQNIYNQALATPRVTLLQYAGGGYNGLANYISYYPFMQGKDETHLQLLETLIREEAGVTTDGIHYDHVFTDSVKNMDNEEFVDNLTTIWIKELDGIITRSKNNNNATTTPQTLDSLNVSFSKTPNSYIQRNETLDEIKIDSFAQSWDDPSETDYIHELFWYIVYDEAKVNFTMQKVKETWLAQKSAGGDNNVSNTPEKRQTFINIGINNQIGAIGQIFRKAYETDMKDELFEAYDVAPYKMRLKESIYQLGKDELMGLFTRACQKVYAITKP